MKKTYWLKGEWTSGATTAGDCGVEITFDLEFVKKMHTAAEYVREQGVSGVEIVSFDPEWYQGDGKESGPWFVDWSRMMVRHTYFFLEAEEWESQDRYYVFDLSLNDIFRDFGLPLLPEIQQENKNKRLPMTDTQAAASAMVDGFLDKEQGAA